LGAKLHLIKALYVPIAKEPVVRQFEDVCRRKNIKFSNAVIALIEVQMFNLKTSEKRKLDLPAIEDYLTSEKIAFKARDKKRDENWKAGKK